LKLPSFESLEGRAIPAIGELQSGTASGEAGQTVVKDWFVSGHAFRHATDVAL
jgi:hypothetical protein